MVHGSDKIACFQFTSNRIQVIVGLEVLRTYVNNYASLDYFWLCNSTVYPSKMAQHSYNLISGGYPKFLRKLLPLIGYSKFSLNHNLPFSNKQFVAAYRELSKQISSLRNISDFSKLEFCDIKPGSALANVLVFEYQSQDLDIKVIEPQIQLMLRSYLEVYFKVTNYLVSSGCLHVVLYNGRFLHERAAWDACSKQNIEVTIFETTRDRFHMRKNIGFHDRVTNQNLMISHWETSNISEKKKIEIGSLYFETLQSEKNVHFTSVNNYDKLPKKFLVYFSNSDDEAVGFWDSWSSGGITQFEAIKFLSTQLRETDYSLIVRLHPNLKSKPITEQARWEGLKQLENILVVDQFSPLSSYQLLTKASGVITFGSTIGLEAAFHQIPSLVLADCWYDLLGAVDKAYSLEELRTWVIQLPLEKHDLVKRKKNATIRGFWLETAGNQIQNSVMVEGGWGAWDVLTYFGVKVKPHRYFDIFHILQNRIARRVAKLPRR